MFSRFSMDGTHIGNVFGTSLDQKILNFLVDRCALLGVLDDINEFAAHIHKPVKQSNGKPVHITYLRGKTHNLEIVLSHNAIDLNLVYVSRKAAVNAVDESFSIDLNGKYETICYFSSSVRRAKLTFEAIDSSSLGNPILHDLKRSFERAVKDDCFSYAWSETHHICTAKDPKLRDPKNNQLYCALQCFVDVFSDRVQKEVYTAPLPSKRFDAQNVEENIHQ